MTKVTLTTPTINMLRDAIDQGYEYLGGLHDWLDEMRLENDYNGSYELGIQDTLQEIKETRTALAKGIKNLRKMGVNP